MRVLSSSGGSNLFIFIAENKRQFSFELEQSESENSVTSDQLEMVFRFDSSTSSESGEEMNETFTADKIREDQVNLKKKRKETRNHAKGGEKTRSGKIRYPCTNDGCERSYSRKNKASYHTRHECGNKELRFKCGYCDYKSSRASNTRRHIIDTHQGCTYNILDISDGNRRYCPPKPATIHSCQKKNNCLKQKSV
ncbi:hypothetical protein QAD02_022662 [Eretmocerus hayati]|uniref:Uncharacterized protein n=1 Tax=Eretmocerus hayati TaxID=131215 RepID=A0ACC2PUS0_9HYME|nr:hypothetical protein QAD02_022662 [Eretmocerus hayati]